MTFRSEPFTRKWHSNRSLVEAFIHGAVRTKDWDDPRSNSMKIREFGLPGVRPGKRTREPLPTLYSYNTPIAVNLGNRRFAINPNRYSPTTGSHQSELSMALHREMIDPRRDGKTWRPEHGQGMYHNNDNWRDQYTYEWAFVIYEYDEDPMPDELRVKYEQAMTILSDAMQTEPRASNVLWWAQGQIQRALDGTVRWRTSPAGSDPVRHVQGVIENFVEGEKIRKTPPDLDKVRKVTTFDGKSFHGGRFQYDMPRLRADGTWEPGAWAPTIDGDIVLCGNGYHVTTQPQDWGGKPLVDGRPDLYRSYSYSNIVWMVEVEGFGERQTGSQEKSNWRRIRLIAPDPEYAGSVRYIEKEQRRIGAVANPTEAMVNAYVEAIRDE